MLLSVSYELGRKKSCQKLNRNRGIDHLIKNMIEIDKLIYGMHLRIHGFLKLLILIVKKDIQGAEKRILPLKIMIKGTF